MNAIQKLILKEHPDYDFNRYSFKPGDFVTTLDGAQIVVEYSAIDYVSAFVTRRSLKYRTLGAQRVYYKDLPYFNKGEFVNKVPMETKSIKWNLYDIVRLYDGGELQVLITKDEGRQSFIGFVLESSNSYYLHTSIYVVNPYQDYFI